MTVTFDGVEIKNASKISRIYPTLTTDTVVLSGKHSVQSNTNYGYSARFAGFGSLSDVTDLLAKVGTKATLVVNGVSFTNCYISGGVQVDESDNPSWYTYTVEFVQETI